MTFENVLKILEDFTGPPVDGDHEQHTKDAMFAVYNLMNLSRPCPHCGTTEYLCGFNGVGCQSDNANS